MIISKDYFNRQLPKRSDLQLRKDIFKNQIWLTALFGFKEGKESKPPSDESNHQRAMHVFLKCVLSFSFLPVSVVIRHC